MLGETQPVKASRRVNPATQFPTILCGPSRKNVVSQGLTLIQVRSFQLPALAHHVSAAENSLQRICKITRFPDACAGCASEPAPRARTRTARTQEGSRCMKIEACILHLCCKASRRSSSTRAMEGGSEKEGKVFCASPPPHQSRGEMPQPKGGKKMKPICAKLASCNHSCKVCNVHGCSPSRVGAF